MHKISTTITNGTYCDVVAAQCHHPRTVLNRNRLRSTRTRHQPINQLGVSGVCLNSENEHHCGNLYLPDSREMCFVKVRYIMSLLTCFVTILSSYLMSFVTYFLVQELHKRLPYLLPRSRDAEHAARAVLCRASTFDLRICAAPQKKTVAPQMLLRQ